MQVEELTVWKSKVFKQPSRQEMQSESQVESRSVLIRIRPLAALPRLIDYTREFMQPTCRRTNLRSARHQANRQIAWSCAAGCSAAPCPHLEAAPLQNRNRQHCGLSSEVSNRRASDVDHTCAGISKENGQELTQHGFGALAPATPPASASSRAGRGTPNAAAACSSIAEPQLLGPPCKEGTVQRRR